MISLQTNVTSMMAQNNLNIDDAFQSQTIEQLTSGYRINSSSDDAAGLAVANQFRSDINELQQGVLNANDGVSQLQIIDGGLSNISTMLDRMKTLATESASTTFTGDRGTLNSEYQQLSSEITRQASNIGLNSGGGFNTNMSVYIGGGRTSTQSGSSAVNIDLSGNSNAVDAASLLLTNTNVLGGGVGLSASGTANTQRLDAPGATFLTDTSGDQASQTFNFNVYQNGASVQVAATAKGDATGTAGVSASSVLSQLNGQLNQYGITAQIASDGTLQFSGATAFTVTDGNETDTGGTAAAGLTNVASGTAENTSNYIVDGQATYGTGTAQTLSFETSQGAASVSLLAGDNLSSAISKINAQTASLGVFAVANSAGTGISLQSGSSFSVNTNHAGVFSAASNNTAAAPTTGSSTNATAAIGAINTAVQSLGLVQGVVGSGENKLNYAISLAQSQISNFSAAESQIRDADVAQEAANLTKSQVLQQASIAAMAQANSAPQAVLKLLQ